MQRDTGLRFVACNDIPAIALENDLNHKVGDPAIIKGKLYHTRGKWKGQFFAYYVICGGREQIGTEDDFSIIPQNRNNICV
jgi:hypothetical protein